MCSENRLNWFNITAQMSGSLMLDDVVHGLRTFRPAGVGRAMAIVLAGFDGLSTLPFRMYVAGFAGLVGDNVTIVFEHVPVLVLAVGDVAMPPVTEEMTNIGAAVTAVADGGDDLGIASTWRMEIWFGVSSDEVDSDCGSDDRVINCSDDSTRTCAVFMCCSSEFSEVLTCLWI